MDIQGGTGGSCQGEDDCRPVLLRLLVPAQATRLMGPRFVGQKSSGFNTAVAASGDTGGPFSEPTKDFSMKKTLALLALAAAAGIPGAGGL